MGLDVTLYPATEHDEEERLDAVLYGTDDGPPSTATDEEKAVARAAVIALRERRQKPTGERYPDHICNRRYLRSSYNAGGFNSAVPLFVGQPHDLYWVFEPLRGGGEADYVTRLGPEHVPALAECGKRAEEVLAELRAADGLTVTTVDAQAVRADVTTGTPEGALAWYREQVARDAADTFGGAGWSSAAGTYFGKDGLTVLAATPGRAVLGRPAVHLVHKAHPDGVPSFYTEMAEIVGDFIAEATRLATDGGAVMTWSG